MSRFKNLIGLVQIIWLAFRIALIPASILIVLLLVATFLPKTPEPISGYSPEPQRTAAQPQRQEQDLTAYVSAFVNQLPASGVDPSLIAEAVARDGAITIRVQNTWHPIHKQVRYQNAQNLLRLWVSIRKPQTPELESIRLIDLNGNKVGSGTMNWLSVID